MTVWERVTTENAGRILGPFLACDHRKRLVPVCDLCGREGKTWPYRDQNGREWWLCDSDTNRCSRDGFQREPVK